MTSLQMKVVFAAALGVLTLLPNAHADEWNQKTYFTFSAPVEIPGQVLPAGTYVFKLHNSSSNRHIVQVFNREENHVFGTFLAIPDYHMKPSGEPIVKFHERAAGSPTAIKAWFYPGRNYGHEFVYPKNKAVALAAANNTPVPAMPTELTSDTVVPDITIDAPEILAMVVAPLVVERPSGQEVEVAADFETEPPPSSELPETLPSTASLLPLIGLLGVLSIGTAFSLRLAAAKQK